MSERYDLVVVGGGVIGLAVAYEAGRRGLKVLVVSRQEVGAATPVSGGMLAPAAESADIKPALAALALASCRLYPDFVAGLESLTGLACNYVPRGTLMVALHRDHWAELEHLAQAQHALGLRALRLTADGVREREPYVSPRQVGGLYLQDDHQVDPRRLHAALAAALPKLGGAIVNEARVVGLDGRVVTLERGVERWRVDAGALVLAAGVWSNDALTDLPHLPLRAVRGQIVRLHGAAIATHVIRTPEVYVVPRAQGELLIGGISEEAGLDPTPSAGAVYALLREAWAVLPGIAEHGFSETAVGFRPALRDHLPAIGPWGEHVFVATGHYRHGIMLAPITAQLLVENVSSGVTPPALAPFLPTRFSEEAPHASPHQR